MPFHQLKRRDFITLLGGAAALWPRTARAQQPAMPVIGFLNTASPGPYTDRVRAFRQGLSDSGYVEGRNVAIEYHWAEGQFDRLPAMAADLVRRQVSVIAVNGPGALVAKAATTMIPIVFQIAGNPVEYGLVSSLNRPGGNITGVTTLGVEVGPKRLEVLHELVPTATSLAVLVNPTNSNTEVQSKEVQAAARTLGVELHILHASTERDFDTAFTTISQIKAEALLIGTDPFFNSRSDVLAAMANHLSLPAIYQYREFAAAGGLASYGGSFTEPLRLAGAYTGRILKGEAPANLPVQQSTKIELIINLKTAKALGLTVPLIMQMTADEVIE